VEHSTCHICRESRPVNRLSIEEHKTVLPGTNTKVLERVQYCNDKAECTSAAPNFSFINTGVSAISARQRTQPGEPVTGRQQDERSITYDSEGKVIRADPA
jgi:hypothetical protein